MIIASHNTLDKTLIDYVATSYIETIVSYCKLSTVLVLYKLEFLKYLCGLTDNTPGIKNSDCQLRELNALTDKCRGRSRNSYLVGFTSGQSAPKNF